MTQDLFPEIKMSLDALRSLQLERLKSVLRHAYVAVWRENTLGGCRIIGKAGALLSARLIAHREIQLSLLRFGTMLGEERFFL